MHTPQVGCREASTRLTSEDEPLWIDLAQHNHIVARDELLAVHLPCIRRLARRFWCPGLDVDDLAQEGARTFYEVALPRYERRSPPVRLWTYARRGAWLAMRDACVLWHRIGDAARRAAGQVHASQEYLTQALAREPAPAEIAQDTGVVEVVVRAVLEMWERTESLDGPDEEEDGADAPARDVAATGPELDARLRAAQLYARIVALLGTAAGWKFILFSLLREYGDCGWREIGALLDGGAGGELLWAAVCTDQPLPATVPRDWAGLWAVCAAPPPQHTETALRAWYVQKRAELRARGVDR